MVGYDRSAEGLGDRSVSGRVMDQSVGTLMGQWVGPVMDWSMIGMIGGWGDKWVV